MHLRVWPIFRCHKSQGDRMGNSSNCQGAALRLPKSCRPSLGMSLHLRSFLHAFAGTTVCLSCTVRRSLALDEGPTREQLSLITHLGTWWRIQQGNFAGLIRGSQENRTHNGGGGEQQGEHGGDKLVETDAGRSGEQCTAAAEVHCPHLPRQQTDAHHSQRPVHTTM